MDGSPQAHRPAPVSRRFGDPKRRVSACALTFILGVTLLAPTAHARSNGFPTPGCDGCHSLRDFEGNIDLMADGEVAPGEATNFTLTIEESHMVAAGFYVLIEDDVGRLSPAQGASARLISDTDLVQSRPHAADGGVVTVNFSWTPPATAGGTDIYVFAVAANLDRTNSGDRASAARFSYTWGCDPFTLYRDIDGDGFGVDDETRPDCNEREGWSTVGGDCNDLWASIYPDATEIGNSKDDDCDGDVDEGVDMTLVYPDEDGDGFGDMFADPVTTRPDLVGHVPNAGDCNDDDAAVHPNAEEVCDGIDNNCDHQHDEGTFEYCGKGICTRRISSCEQECIPGQPEEEICNGVDDDCDGVIDDGAECPEGQVCQFRCVPEDQLDAGILTSDPDAVGATADGNTDAGNQPSASEEDGASSRGVAIRTEDVKPQDAGSAAEEESVDASAAGEPDVVRPEDRSRSSSCSVNEGGMPHGSGLATLFWSLLASGLASNRRRDSRPRRLR